MASMMSVSVESAYDHLSSAAGFSDNFPGIYIFDLDQVQALVAEISGHPVAGNG